MFVQKSLGVALVALALSTSFSLGAAGPETVLEIRDCDSKAVATTERSTGNPYAYLFEDRYRCRSLPGASDTGTTSGFGGQSSDGLTDTRVLTSR